MMLQENGTSEKSSSNVTIFKNGFEDISSLEEADCFLEFLSQEYPGNGKILLFSFFLSLLSPPFLSISIVNNNEIQNS